MAKQKTDAPKRRNVVVQNMIARYANTRTCHGDKKKAQSKKACRGKVKW